VYLKRVTIPVYSRRVTIPEGRKADRRKKKYCNVRQNNQRSSNQVDSRVSNQIQGWTLGNETSGGTYKGRSDLLKCKSTNKGGHVYLILNQEEYRHKIKDETATLPCKTIRPKKPIGDTVTTASYAIYKE
jgi:hypothetical protein